VREDNYVPVVALGFGEPYALVLSSHWIELFADDELSFMIGRELGHIAAGHTRFHSLLSVNGNENPIVALIFGAWLRRCALTCDKVGLLCCGSLDAAIRAMGIAAFHEFGRKVDYEAFAEQDAEIQADSVLRWGSWLSSEPYATQRITSLRRFIATNNYANAEEWFLRERSEEPPALAAPGAFRVTRNDCAGWWRRFAAFGIDGVIVTAIITSFGGSVVSSSTRGAAVRVAGQNVPLNVDALASYIGNAIAHLGVFFWLPIYLAVLVIVAGQTFGMMIAGLRVVTIDYGKPSILRTIARYLIVFALWWVIMPLSLVWRRELLHDRWTKTRVVMVERVVARITGTT
ncbi:MAG TPA: RDD family protein, partial [Candidatus Baltobacteraceae bacterium]|nr:RDD family protein [Candidatus Baltobacteraceae bacterium]